MTKYRYARPKLRRSGPLRKSHNGYLNAAHAFERGAHSLEVIGHLLSDLDLIAEAELQHVKPLDLARLIACETWPKRWLKTGRVTV